MVLLVYRLRSTREDRLGREFVRARGAFPRRGNGSRRAGQIRGLQVDRQRRATRRASHLLPARGGARRVLRDALAVEDVFAPGERRVIRIHLILAHSAVVLGLLRPRGGLELGILAQLTARPLTLALCLATDLTLAPATLLFPALVVAAAEAAGHPFRLDLARRRGGFGVQDEIRVVARLPQSGEELEDVGVVVEDGTFLDVPVEFSASEHVQRLVKIALHFVHLRLANVDGERGQFHVLGALRLRATELRGEQDVVSQGEKTLPSIADVSVPIDRIYDRLVEVTVVPRARVAARGARALLRPEIPAERLTFATLHLAKVVRVRVHAEETDE